VNTVYNFHFRANP